MLWCVLNVVKVWPLQKIKTSYILYEAANFLFNVYDVVDFSIVLKSFKTSSQYFESHFFASCYFGDIDYIFIPIGVLDNY